MIRKSLLLIVVCIMAAGLLTGCDMNLLAKENKPKKPTPPREEKKPVEPKQPETQPATQPAETPEPTAENSMPQFKMEQQQQVLANVNGKPIFMDSLHDALVEDYGLPIAQQMIADEVVKQALKSRNMSTNVTQKDIDRESMRAMKLLFGMDEKYTDEQLDSLLTQFLARNRYTRRQWNQTMARNALLTRLAEGSVKVTDEELQQAYLQKYDSKYIAKHIQVANLNDAQKVLNELKNGSEFTDMVFKYSISPTAKAGGNLPEVGSKTAPKTLTPSIVSVIRSLKPGEVSDPVQAGTTFHIIKLIKITKPADVKFDDVKLDLQAVVKEYKVQQAQQILMRELLKNATIEYINPTIRQQQKQKSENR